MNVGTVLEGSEIADQIVLETESIEEGVRRYRRLAKEAVDRGDGSWLKPAERLLLYWFAPLCEAIRAEQVEVLAGKPGKGRAHYGPVLLMIDCERLAVITMHEMLSRCMQQPDGDLVMKMTYAIGNAVLAEINYELMRKENSGGVDELDRRFKNQNPARVNRWAKKTLADPIWERKICTHVGAILLHIACGVCMVEVEVKKHGEIETEWEPAFTHTRRWIEQRQKGVVRLSSEALEIIEDGHLFRQHLRPRFMPMIVEPYPWSPECEGGYVKVRTPFMAKPSKEQKEAYESQDISQVYEALNALNACPWSINKPVLNVMEELWDQGGGIAGVPSCDSIPMPPKPNNISTNEDALKKWKAEAHEVHTLNAKLRGARVEFLQKIHMAKKMLGYDKFFLPHQLDFRTRLYPIPPTLNHHGDDNSRSILLSGRAVPLNDRGRWWLRVHAANMWGFDKASFSDRVMFIEDQMPTLHQIVSDPVGTVEHWSKAAEPMQFLAAAMAIFDDNIGEHLLVLVDGTANGIQHLVAAGRDERGAAAVNLVPSDRPGDPYADVLEVVQDRARVAAANGNQLAKYSIDNQLLVRNLVKRPTMTQVYNVTRVGARQQVLDELSKMGVPRDAGRFQLAHYLSGEILESVGDAFPVARAIMGWIAECTRIMVKARPHEPLRWTTPMGFPCVQPYRNIKKFRVHTIVQQVVLGHRDEEAPVSPSKQVQGSIPNIIHSWDGSHEQSVAIEMNERGKDYAAVHDGYKTHASNMDTLVDITQYQFVEMHKQMLLQGLYEEWSANYPEVDLPEPPPLGTLDIECVLQSPYFFS